MINYAESFSPESANAKKKELNLMNLGMTIDLYMPNGRDYRKEIKDLLEQIQEEVKGVDVFDRNTEDKIAAVVERWGNAEGLRLGEEYIDPIIGEILSTINYRLEKSKK